jgi:hypothetical protein
MFAQNITSELAYLRQESNLTTITITIGTALLYITYRLVHAVYQLYFHPLAKFPGPRAAALSNDWVWRVSQGGAAEKVFAELHKTYSECGRP